MVTQKKLTSMAMVLLLAMISFAQAQTPDILNQIPKDAAVVIVAPNLAKTNANVAKLLKTLGVNEPEAADPIGSFLEELEIDKKGINLKGSLAIVITDLMPMMAGGEPPVVVILPISDYAGFVGQFDEAESDEPLPDGIKALEVNDVPMPLFIKQMGTYAVVSNQMKIVGDYSAAMGATDILKNMGTLGQAAIVKGDVIAMFNVAKISPMLQPMLAMGLVAVKSEIENEPGFQAVPGAKELATGALKLVGEFANNFLRDTQSMMLIGSIDEQGVGYSMLTQFKPDSAMAKAFGTNTTTVKFDQLPMKPYLFAMSMDMTGLPIKAVVDSIEKELFAKIPTDSPLTPLVKAYSKALAATLLVKQQQAAWYAGKGGDMTDLFNMAGVIATDDPKQYTKLIREYIEEYITGMSSFMKGLDEDAELPMTMKYDANAITIDGKSLDKITMKMNMTPEMQQAMQQDPGAAMIMGMFGKGFINYFATSDNAVLMTQGIGDKTDLMKEMLTVADGSGKFGSMQVITDIRKQLPEHRIMEGYVNITQVMQMGVGMFMGMMGGEAPPAPAAAVDTPPMAVSLSVHDGGIQFHYYLPTSAMLAIKNMVEQMGEAMGGGMGPGGDAIMIEEEVTIEETDAEPDRVKVKANTKVTAVTDADFAAKTGQGVVLVDFWATWCAPCLQQAPIVETLANKYTDKATFYKLDIDANDKTAQQFKITAIPTILIFKDGQQVQKFVGLTSKEDLEKAIKKHTK